MGDSSPCLMQPFCYASGFSHEDTKSNSTYALGQSVSFGRFMSESLEWDKWSSFSSNRYVEEAERFSRPGSVAEKKAFFEAHYKKLAAQKAAALLEQQTQQEQEAEVDNIHDSQITSPKSKLVFSEENAKVLHSGPDATRYSSDSNSVLVKLQNQVEDVDNTHMNLNEKVRGIPPMDTPKLEELLQEGSNHDQEVLQSMGKKKASFSPFKLWKDIGNSKLISTPVKSINPIISTEENVATPVNDPASSSVDKRRSTAKMSLNFTLIRQINRLSASVMRKFESTRVDTGSSKDSKDSSNPLRTPNKASKTELPKHSSFIPLTEEKRHEMTSPIISSPFSLRTEERAEIRKKKLDKRIDASGAQKVQLHRKLKEKAQVKIRKLRRSFCFSTGPLPEFYKEREESKKGTKEDLLTPPESPKLGRTPSPIVVEGKISSSSKRFFHEKNGSATLTLPQISNSTVIMTHENTSPNIQHGKQNDRNY